jgi:rhomboid protease GluP
MKNYLKKVRYILPTFLIIYILGVFIPCFFRLIFEIKYHLIELDEIIWKFWIPIIFSLILLLFFLRPRLRILSFKEKVDD